MTTSSLSIQTVPSGSPTIQALIANILNYQYSPAAMQQVAFNYLAEVTLGTVTIVDPTSPYVHAIETGAVNTAAFMQKVEALNRKQYPVAAQTMSDLYLHMADTDYVNRFAVPASTTWSLLLSESELLAKLVLNPTTGLKQLTIPRNTFFAVGGVQFSLQYPIVIQQMLHGGLSITYDTTIVSPLQTLSSNLVTWSYRPAADQTWIYLEFPVQQFDIITRNGTCTAAKAFSLTVPVAAQFYYCRVYSMDPNTGLWVEMDVTYSTEIYDVNTPTAVVTLGTNTQTGAVQAVVSIPQVYTSTKLVNQSIRIDVYETVGPVNMELSNYASSAFSATFLAIDANDDTIFTAPLATLQNLITYSDKTVIGGTDAIGFTTLRQQVIDNSVGPQSVPITPAQLTDVLEQDGFGVVKTVDNITDRKYLATAPMPQPTDSTLITAANSTIETVSTSVALAVTHSAVIDNDTSVTITPAMLYQNNNGVVSMVSDTVIAQLSAMSVSNKALAISSGNYLWSPFYYVVDLTESELALRAYYLSAPEIVTKLWVGENDLTGLEVSTDTASFITTANGYQLVLATTSSASYQALDDSTVFCQLSFIPPGETARAYLQGTLTGTTSAGERQFTFDLSTNYNIDANTYLYLSKFFLYNTNARLTGAELQTTFDVIYSTSATMPSNWVAGAVDAVIGKYLLPTGAVGITNEQLVLKFGDYLDTLWTQCRTVVSTLTYEKYQTNVPYYYTEDVYEIDPTTGSAFSVVNGTLEFTILHHVGDAILNADGTPSYRYKVGDVVLDGEGNPIPTSTRGLTLELDLMLIEAAYRFATDTVAPAYVTQLVSTVVGWLTGSFETLNESLLENTELYYYPVANMGTVQVYGADGLTHNIDAGQSFVVTLLVSKATYENDALKQTLQKITTSTIAAQLGQTIVSDSAIDAALETIYGSDVISFTQTGLGGSTGLDTITLIDNSTQLGLAKQLVANANGTLSVQEAVTVNFVKYAVGN